MDKNHQYKIGSEDAQNLETLEFDDVTITTSPATPVANKSDTLKTTAFTAGSDDTITLKTNSAAQIKYSGPAANLTRSLGSIAGGKFDTTLTLEIRAVSQEQDAAKALYVSVGINTGDALVCEVIPAVYVATTSQ